MNYTCKRQCGARFQSMTQLQVHGLASYVDPLGLFYKVGRCIEITWDTCIRWSNGRWTDWDSYLAVSFSHTDVVKALQRPYRTDSMAAYWTISKLPLPFYQSRSDLALQGHPWEELDLASQKHLWRGRRPQQATVLGSAAASHSKATCLLISLEISPMNE